MDNNKKLRIAFVTQPIYHTFFPHPDDSIGIVTAQIVRRLAQNCDVVVYTPAKGKILKKRTEYYENVCYEYIPIIIDILLLKIIRHFPKVFNPEKSGFASNLYYFFYGMAIAIELRKKKIDIVHIHNFSQFIPIIRKLNPEIKIALHMHCQWLTQLDHDMIEQRIQQADLVISCSEFITEEIRRRFPAFAIRCQTLYNGVDRHFFTTNNIHEYRKPNDVKQLLFVGRISPEKGVHILLEALEKVVEFFPEVHLNLVGSTKASCPEEFIIALSNDNPKVADLISFYAADPITGKKLSYFEQLQKRIPPELAKHITFCGSVPYEKLNKYYQDADILVNSSLSEALGMPILEAMAGSTPVIGSRVGGIPEAIVNNKTGLIVEPGDSIELTEAIVSILNNEDRSLAMGIAGYQRANQLFCWDRIAKRLIDYYKNLF